MGPIHELAVFSVRLTVAHEHPEALHDLALYDHRRCVPVMLVPNVFRDAFDKLEMPLVLLERARRVFRIFIHGQLSHSPLVVNDKKAQKIIDALNIKHIALHDETTTSILLNQAVAFFDLCES